MRDTAAPLAAPDGIESLGVGVAPDGFGTGPPGLSHLRRSPFGTMRIDRGCVCDVAREGGALAFVRAVDTPGCGVENHAHGIAVYFMHHNFVRIHQTLRCTPAMAAKVTDRLWAVGARQYG